MNHTATITELQATRAQTDEDTRSKPTDFIKAEQHEILQLFYRIGNRRLARGDRVQLIQELCDQLTIYLAVKEDVVMPAIEKVCDTPAFKEQLDESVIEHFLLKVMLETLDGEGPEDQLFQAKLTMLKRQFIGHVGFEEGFLLPYLATLLPQGLVKSMSSHKQKLLKEVCA